MPQPLHPKVTSWSSGSEFVANARPDCVLCVGRTALAWSQTEESLNCMLSGVLGRTSRDEHGGRGVNPNWIARAALAQAETIRIRLKIANAILSKLLEGDDLLAAWDLLSSELFKRSRERNVVVHTSWAWSEDAPDGLIQPDDSASGSFWVLKDFQNVLKRIVSTDVKVRKFQGEVLDAIHDGRITKYVTPDMIMK